MNGAKVYINDNVLCGELNTNWHRGYNRWLKVNCDQDVVAESVSIVGDSGVSVCGIFTWTSDM